VSVTILTSPLFADHLTPPGHPERVERFEVMQAIAAEFRETGVAVEQPRPATKAEIARIHDAEYISLVQDTAGRAMALDPDTFTSPHTWEAACLASGAVVGAVDRVLDGGPGSRVFALVRPPGHHAERSRAMGFCFFNSIAIGAAHARARGLARVAIVDFDVHHGNGTQWSFYDDPSVLFVSSHQYPFYPGTGAASDVGAGGGAGFTVNLPFQAGATDVDYDAAYTRIVVPVLEQFRPEILLVSAGFDAHMDDPLAGMRLTSPYFGRLMGMLAGVADRVCQGRLVAVTEGGYDLAALASSLRASLRALLGHEFQVPAGAAPRGEATITAVRPHLSTYWPL
jgi:acetoin utilization deacetylase AcuC-like enzyme